MQLDLLTPRPVSGLVVQGAAHVAEYVTTVSVAYTDDPAAGGWTNSTVQNMDVSGGWTTVQGMDVSVGTSGGMGKFQGRTAAQIFTFTCECVGRERGHVLCLRAVVL